MTHHPFTARRSPIHGWIVAVGGRSDAIVAKFGQDEDRAKALAFTLNNATDSAVENYENALRRMPRANG